MALRVREEVTHINTKDGTTAQQMAAEQGVKDLDDHDDCGEGEREGHLAGGTESERESDIIR